MEYYLPKGVALEAALEKGWILPKNFLGKMENVRLLTKEETSWLEIYRRSKATQRQTGARHLTY